MSYFYRNRYNPGCEAPPSNPRGQGRRWHQPSYYRANSYYPFPAEYNHYGRSAVLSSYNPYSVPVPVPAPALPPTSVQPLGETLGRFNLARVKSYQKMTPRRQQFEPSTGIAQNRSLGRSDPLDKYGSKERPYNYSTLTNFRVKEEQKPPASTYQPPLHSQARLRHAEQRKAEQKPKPPVAPAKEQSESLFNEDKPEQKADNVQS